MYGIVRMQKYHYNDMAGIEDHIERRAKKSNTNPDIEKKKSKLNYDLTGLKDFTLKSLIKKRLKDTDIKIHKNSVCMTELMFTASHEFFKNMKEEEIKEYFTKCYEFACKYYGKENIIAAEVHLDEKTPHLHLEMIPITKDGRLCNKEIFNKKGLKQLQDKAHDEIFKQYGLQRGESNKDVKHLSTLRYKVKTLQKQRESLQKQVDYLTIARDTDKLYQTQQKLEKVMSDLEKLKTLIKNDPELTQAFLKAMEKIEKREEKEQPKNETGKEEKQIDK